MLPIYLCDSDQEQLIYMKKLISDILLFESLDAKIVFADSTPSRLISYLSIHEAPSLYFLTLEDEDAAEGFLLAKSIRKHDPRGFIVFLSSQDSYLSLTFEHNTEAMDYILKDCPNIHLRICKCISHALDLYTLPSNKVQKVIGIRIDGRIITIKLSEIYCIETSPEAHKIRIYNKSGYTELFFSLKDICHLLDDSFFQCHKSCIVNLSFIKELDHKNYTITLENKKICPVATRLMHTLISKIHI